MTFRKAVRSDISLIVKMLAADFLGKTREKYEDPLPQSYYDAFDKINEDLNNDLIVMEDNGEVIGTMQLTFIPSLNYCGSTRMLIESVRVRDDLTGKGYGSKLIKYAIDIAKEKNCKMVQLTTDKKRKDAHRFYERLGFTATHEGMKLHL